MRLFGLFFEKVPRVVTTQENYGEDIWHSQMALFFDKNGRAYYALAGNSDKQIFDVNYWNGSLFCGKTVTRRY